MKRILYIEDSIDTAEAVQILLNRAGFKTDIAFNGKDGLKKISGDSYDLILLDVMLPDMSGWDIFEKIKSLKGVKFAFLSAIPVTAERMVELRRVGVSDYITKPFTKEGLLKRVKAILS